MTSVLSDNGEPSSAPTRSSVPVLDVQDLHVHFPNESGALHAVRGVSFTLLAGETLAIVGESGSGKSATAMAIMGLQPSGARVEGSIVLQGDQLAGLDDESMSRLRGKSIAMVFQDPLSSMTPVYTVGEQIIESIQIHDDCSAKVALSRAVELLALVGIPDPSRRVHAYPHEFSGGMRQRVLIAMAIANNPDVIIADEPTTALDVTIQAQVLDVLKKACQETHAALLLITHDLGVVARVADKALVMYAGKAVEQGEVRSLFYHSRMPYTMGLLGSLPHAGNARLQRLTAITGHPPSLAALPSGCSFSPRCPMVAEPCLLEEPTLVGVGEDGHKAACVRHHEITSKSLTHSELFQAGSAFTDSPVKPSAIDSAHTSIDVNVSTPVGTGPSEFEDTAALTSADTATSPSGDPFQPLSTNTRDKVLEMSAVKQHFPLLEGGVFRKKAGTVYAVDGIDLHVRQGETLGLVGESGCGKSTTTLSILDLKAPTSGSIQVFGTDVRHLDSKAMRLKVRRQLQIVFQDPLSSLDPRMPVFDLIAEPMGVFGYSEAAVASRVNELISLVGLDNSHLERYPQQLSGGQCQRVCIARALALEPQLLILDEPVSALDVSIRAGIVNLLQDLKISLGLSYLFVAHDLALIRHIADRVAVMYLGRIVESGEVNDVYENPTHPYTRCLLSAMPIPDPDVERDRVRLIPVGELPSPANPPTGCHFHTRCPKKNELSDVQQQRCVNESPALIAVRDNASASTTPELESHTSACHYNHVSW